MIAEQTKHWYYIIKIKLLILKLYRKWQTNKWLLKNLRIKTSNRQLITTEDVIEEIIEIELQIQNYL